MLSRTIVAAAGVAAGSAGVAAMCQSDDNIVLPKSVVTATAAGIVAATGLYLFSTAPTREQVKTNITSMQHIGLKLKQSLDSSHEILGTPPLSLKETLDATSVLIDTWKTWHTTRPLFQVEEVTSVPGVEGVSKQVADELNRQLPLALAAYVADDDELSAELARSGLRLLYHDPTTIAGKRTSHYVAYDADAKRVVIGIQGTSNVDDVLTDCICQAVPLRRKLHAIETLVATADEVLAHEAMSEAAHHLKERIGPLVKDLFALRGYDVLVTGHSLGAGTACLLAILLRDELQISGVRAIGYATPPVVDKMSALRAKSYIWSVVNHTDVVPRASVRNIQLLSQLLHGTLEVLREHGAATAQERVVSVAKEVLSARTELPAADLYVPGKVLYAYADGTGTYHAAVHDGTLPMLATIMPSTTLITDHLSGPYTEALRQVSAAAAGGAPAAVAADRSACKVA